MQTDRQTDAGMQNWPSCSAAKTHRAGRDGSAWPCDAHGQDETQSSLESMGRLLLTQQDLNWVSKGLLPAGARGSTELHGRMARDFGRQITVFITQLRSFAAFSSGISFRATRPQAKALLDIITRSDSQRCKALPRLHGLLPATSNWKKGPCKVPGCRQGTSALHRDPQPAPKDGLRKELKWKGELRTHRGAWH